MTKKKGDKDQKDDNKDLIAYCGLYCGECFGYEERIADLARDLRAELRKKKFDKFARFMSESSFGKVYEHYPECYEVLGAMVKFRCKRACRGGGGNPWCKIRKCCGKKNINGCWMCDDFETCKKLDFLKPVHDDGHLKNLRKLKKQGEEKFLVGKKNW